MFVSFFEFRHRATSLGEAVTGGVDCPVLILMITGREL